MNDIEISADAPITTQLNTRLGGAINYLNDKTDALQAEVDAIEADPLFLRRYVFEQSVTYLSSAYVISITGVWQTITLGLSANTFTVSEQNQDTITLDRRTLQRISGDNGINRNDVLIVDNAGLNISATIAYTSASSITVSFSGDPGSPACLLSGVVMYSLS